MHENDAGRGRPLPQPFAPRLVRDADAGTNGLNEVGESGPAMGLHDPDVREIADSLADLFLGSTDPAPPPRRGADVGLAVGSTPPDTTRVAMAFAAPSNGRAAQREPAPAASAPVEMVVLGHLPVLAGAWLTQYASQAAQSLGKPLALARLEPGGLSIDLFGVPRDVAVERHASLGEALEAARGLVGGWLIRVDELAEAGLADSPRIASLTLLSGVSESSIVAAYRTLKAIVQRAGTTRGLASSGTADELEPREEPAELRIALLGATAERAREASARIRKAAATFLGRPVGVIVCAERIGLTSMRSLYRGGFEGDAARLLEMIAEGSRADRRFGSDAFQGVTHPRDPDPLQPESEIEAKSPAATPAPRMVAGVVDEPAGTASAAPRLERSGPTLRADANPGPRTTGSDLEDLLRDDEWLLGPEAATPTDDRAMDANAPATAALPAPVPSATAAIRTAGSPSAAGTPAATTPNPVVPGTESHAGLLGLSALPIRCPDAPRVELAVDSAGGLHAIVLDEMSAHGGSAAGSDASISTGRAGVAALLAADAWARSNMDLLSRAMPFIKAGEVSLHLLTRVPAAARDLLGTRVKVHLLARASGPGDVCVGLN